MFQKRISQQFEHIPGVETEIDDILIWGKSEAEHDQRLEQVLQKCTELNITLNKDKCIQTSRSMLPRSHYIMWESEA